MFHIVQVLTTIYLLDLFVTYPLITHLLIWLLVVNVVAIAFTGDISTQLQLLTYIQESSKVFFSN